jgi:TolB-like protein
MKKLFTLIFIALLSISARSQTKSSTPLDILQKVNGETLKGKIIKITDQDVSFVYSGETAEYVIKKSDIAQITHSSGRIEVFSQQTAPSETRQKDQVSMVATPVDHHNKIAILPFTFVMDNQPGAETIGLKAQQDAYGLLSQHSAGYTILDPRTTNAALIQAGATRDKIMGFTMKNLCDILGVEYVVDGTVTQAKGYQTSSTSTYGSADVKRDGGDKVSKVSGYSGANSMAVQRYDVSVSLQIYMDNNASIFNQNHKAFMSNTDGSYSGPLEYLLKRCPLYRK